MNIGRKEIQRLREVEKLHWALLVAVEKLLTHSTPKDDEYNEAKAVVEHIVENEHNIPKIMEMYAKINIDNRARRFDFEMYKR